MTRTFRRLRLRERVVWSPLLGSERRIGVLRDRGCSPVHPSWIVRRPSTSESSLNAELCRLPTTIFMSIRQELGVHDKDLPSLTLEEKSRIVTIARQRAANQGARGQGMQPSWIVRHPSTLIWASTTRNFGHLRLRKSWLQNSGQIFKHPP
ncbi:hypothetical protein OG21DRAFT_1502176 [Imleria badia]|nr:hypothetical protein OG21DRAFT_1502176 [Imleria badia]